MQQYNVTRFSSFWNFIVLGSSKDLGMSINSKNKKMVRRDDSFQQCLSTKEVKPLYGFTGCIFYSLKPSEDSFQCSLNSSVLDSGSQWPELRPLVLLEIQILLLCGWWSLPLIILSVEVHGYAYSQSWILFMLNINFSRQTQSRSKLLLP